MNILWLTWKDLKHPLAGGAEVVNEELAKRLAKNGHTVKFVVGGFNSGKEKENINGYEVVRLGNRFSVYWQAYRYYKKHLQGWADLTIDEINTIPFFAKWYAKEPIILFVHQLCRQIWFYQLPAWLGWIGYLLEPLYLRLLSNQKAITVSNSTKKDLMRYGFKPQNISIISEGIALKPIKNLGKVKKFGKPTLLSLGALRAMKRTRHQVKAFEIAKVKIPELQLKIAGDASDTYGQSVLNYIANSPHKKDIEYLGRVTNEKRLELMQKCHVTLQTAVKEGWGLTVTEAASQGTPAVVYNADGLRDSVQNDKTGMVTVPNPGALASGIIEILNNTKQYEKLRKNAWLLSKQITFEQCYKDFKKSAGIA